MKRRKCHFDFALFICIAVLLQLGLNTGSSAQCIYVGEGIGFGGQIKSAGDVNGDGYSDILVAVPDWPLPVSDGKVYILKGSGGGFDGTPLYEISGSNNFERWGYSADGIGDLDGDGKSEFIVSSHLVGTTNPGYDPSPDSGRAIVYNGSDGSPRWVYQGSYDAFGAYGLGYCVAGVGDVDNDNIPDFAIGSRGNSNWAAQGRGRVDIFSGATGDTLQIPGGAHAGENYTLYPDTNFFETKVGLVIAAAGDLNNDNYDDILIYDDDSPKSIIALSGFDRDTLFEIVPFANGGIATGLTSSFPSFSRLAGEGDFNNDNVPDIVVAWNTGGLDSVYVISGVDGSTRLGGPWTEYGGYVDFIGDINSDNYDDIIIGGIPGVNDSGRVVVISGQDQILLYDITGDSGSFLGRRVSGVGDRDGDGSPEFAAGAPGSAFDAGAVYTFEDNACADVSIPAFGFVNTPLGQALLDDGTPGQLTVGNIGSSGQDGVTIDLGMAELCGISLDPTSFQIGGQIVLGAKDTLDNSLASVGIDVSGGTILDFTPDLSPLGATSYRVNVYNGTTLVDFMPGLTGTVATAAGPAGEIKVDMVVNGSGRQTIPGISIVFDTPLSITIAGGSPVTGNRIVMIGENIIITHTHFLRHMEVTGQNLSEIIIMKEELGLYGNLHFGVGQATLLGEEGNDLVISNIGSSGLDGVGIRFYGFDGIDIEGCLFDKPLGLMDVSGSFLDFHAHGLKDGGQTGEPLGSSKVTYNGSAFGLTAGMIPLGVSTFTVEVRDDNGLVGTISGVSGLLAETDSPPVGIKWYNNGINGVGPTYSWVYDPDLLITIPGKGAFTGNRVMIIGEGATSTADALLSQIIYAADLDTLRINSESASPNAQTVTVLSDTGVGSLRWAIDQANSNPGRDIIDFEASGTISLVTALPAITDDSTVILGSTAPAGPQAITIDGSSIPGEVGLAITSSYNSVEGLIFQYFNDGIAVNGTAQRNTIGPDNVVMNCVGNGISFNGVGTGSNRVYGNSIIHNTLNGIYLTGSGFNRIGGYVGGEENLIYDNGQNGVYIYGNSDSNQVIGNQIGVPFGSPEEGNLGDGVAVDFNCDGNLIDFNVIANNGGDGVMVVINSRLNTITHNDIYQNGQLAIDLADDGATANDLGDSDSGPNDLLNYPDIDSVISQPDQSYMIYGQAAADATVEFFLAHPADDETRPADVSGYGEAWLYLGDATASPTGQFSFHDMQSAHFTILTCTATDPLGNTSEMSANFGLLPRPLIIIAYAYDPGKNLDPPLNGIDILVQDPNGDQFGYDTTGAFIDDIPGDQFYSETSVDSVFIPEPIVGDYIINFIAESGDGTGSLYAGIIKVDGSQQVVIIIDEGMPETGQMDSYNYSYTEDSYDYANGDANGDGECNVGDAVFLINYVFKGGPPPVPELSGDSNCDGEVNVGDAVRIISYVFQGGLPPCQSSN